jgi:hypothetical protein
MRRFVVTLSVLIAVLGRSPLAEGKSPDWEKAKVIKADFGGSETEAVAVPLPGGAAVGESSTSSGKHKRGLYWLRTEKYTYVIPNYCKANMIGIQWWLYLTLGGETKVSIGSARTLRVIDDEGKDRKVHIIQRIANDTPNPPQQTGSELRDEKDRR